MPVWFSSKLGRISKCISTSLNVRLTIGTRRPKLHPRVRTTSLEDRAMSTINKGDYDGGRNTTTASGPRDLAGDLQAVADDFTNLHSHLTALLTKVSGLVCLPPTNASTQATGASGALDWNVDISEGFAVANAVEATFAVQADFDVFSDDSPVTDGQSIVGALVASEAAGTTSLEVVNGAAATTGSQVAPTDAQITTGVGHARWVKIAELTLNRTGDTTVTQSQKNSARENFQSGALAALTHLKGRT